MNAIHLSIRREMFFPSRTTRYNLSSSAIMQYLEDMWLRHTKRLLVWRIRIDSWVSMTIRHCQAKPPIRLVRRAVEWSADQTSDSVCSLDKVLVNSSPWTLSRNTRSTYWVRSLLKLMKDLAVHRIVQTFNHFTNVHALKFHYFVYGLLLFYEVG